jgi:biopolymer transport protein ExbB
VKKILLIVLYLCSLSFNSWAASDATLDKLSDGIHNDLEQALGELATLRKTIASEKIPLSQKIRERESEIQQLRKNLDEFRKLEDSKSVDLQSLRDEVKSQEDALFAINRTLSDYTELYNESIQVFESDRYPKHLTDANLPINSRIEAQSQILTLGLDRLLKRSHLVSYQGKAIVSDEPLAQGNFLSAADNLWFLEEKKDNYSIAIGEVSGLTKTIAQGSLGAAQDAAEGYIKLSLAVDLTSGKALLLQSESDSLFSFIQDGGFWVYPILLFGLLSLMIALSKTFELIKAGRIDRKAIDRIMTNTDHLNHESVLQTAKESESAIHQFVTDALNISHSARDQMEDCLLELMQRAKTKQEKHLYMVAVTASVAPLIGLLGTVAGMIETFKMISLFGSSDAMSLSSGISKALITTELGLIVAIPALVMHVLLSRKSQAIMSDMEYYAARIIENKFGYSQ